MHGKAGVDGEVWAALLVYLHTVGTILIRDVKTLYIKICKTKYRLSMILGMGWHLKMQGLAPLLNIKTARVMMFVPPPDHVHKNSSRSRFPVKLNPQPTRDADAQARAKAPTHGA